MLEYTEQELQMLHATLYDIMGEVARVCDVLHIPYFVLGGTAIGVHYFDAIVPWDDDIDIGMTRVNYERFLREAPGVLREGYTLQWVDTDPYTPFYFAKVRRDGTRFVEDITKHLDIHQGIFVDVFPYDIVPDSPFIQKMQRTLAKYLNLAFISKDVWMCKYCGTTQCDNPYNWNIIYCALFRIFVSLFSKKTFYRMFTYVLTFFNNGKGKNYNIVLMRRDHISRSSAENVVLRPFGPLMVYAPSDLTDYLHKHYPRLRKYLPKEEQVNHRPLELTFLKEE